MHFCALVAFSAVGALVSDRQRVTYHPSDLVAASKCGDRCESGRLEHDANGNEIAVFGAGQGGEHHRMLELSLPSVDPFRKAAVFISVDGDFSQPEGGEVDVVVGLSDGQTVWAVGSGNTYADVLRPFDASAPSRPGTGTFFDRYADFGGVGSFHARIELNSQGTRAKVWQQDSQEPDKWQDYPAAAGYPVPTGSAPLWLVLYRDDPPQRYAFRSVAADIQYFNEKGTEVDGAGESEARGGHGMLVLVLVCALCLCLVLISAAIRSRLVRRQVTFQRIPCQDSDWENDMYDDSDIDDDAKSADSGIFAGV